MNISFSNPIYLFLLFIIPLFIFFHFASMRWRSKKALKFANFQAISRVSGVDLFSKNIVILILSCVIVMLLVFSISGTTIHLTREITDFSFVIAIDSSQSMSADDFYPNRMDFSKAVSKEIIDFLPQDTAIGIVSFGAYSFIEKDLTKHKTELKSSTDKIQISNVGGTGFYEAIVTSSNLLFNEKGKTVILLSDGQVTIGDIESTIRHAINNDIVVHTVAIGTEDGGETLFGFSRLEKDTLKSLSYQTGGIFIEGETREEIMENLSQILEFERGRASIDIFLYLIIASIILFVIECLLMNLKYDSLP
jgi:Ca-activated chloride channel homolog